MILVFGQSGQLAQALHPHKDVQCFGRDSANLMQRGAADQLIRKYRPHAVINAAAYTDVDGAEGDRAAALRLNADAPGEMAQTCAALDIPLVHVSSDYVFDGSGHTPWRPADTPNPLGIYGHSKWRGEQAVLGAGGRCVIVRTSWVFSPHGKNFVNTMKSLGRSRAQITVVNDQIGGPTPVAALGAACLDMAQQLHQRRGASGIYHFAGTPYVSWADFAKAIFHHADLRCQVMGVPSASYPTLAQRPLNSRLDCGDISQVFGLAAPAWKDFI